MNRGISMDRGISMNRGSGKSNFGSQCHLQITSYGLQLSPLLGKPVKRKKSAGAYVEGFVEPVLRN